MNDDHDLISRNDPPLYRDVHNNQRLTASPEIDQPLMDQFLDYIDVKEKSRITYKRGLTQFFLFLQKYNIRQPTRNDIIAFRTMLIQTHEANTVQNYIVAIRRFFEWTELRGFYPNIALKLKGAKVSKGHRKDYLTAEQVNMILDKIDTTDPIGMRDYAIISLMVTCALRDIEVYRANIGDLQTIGGFTVLLVQGKGQDQKSAPVRIPGYIEKVIREYLATRGDALIADESSPLFLSYSNNSQFKRLSARSISGIVKARMKDAGFISKRLTAHSLRHTAVTLALLSGSDITTVQQFARHSRIDTTMIYAHHLDELNNSCSEEVSRAVFGDDK